MDIKIETEEPSIAGDGDDLSPFAADLDEDGLPIPSFSSEDDDDEINASDESESKPPPIEDSREESTGFAADFYRSGTDWSLLVDKKESRSLVQRDLFQMWGIKNKKPSEAKRPRVSSNQQDLFEVWGIKKPSVSLSQPPRKRTRKENGNGSGFDRPRACPFYKKIPGTPFTVDAFRYGSIEGCSAYFLSHFHYDHYGGLSKKWSHGPIYCTALTARLVKMCLGVNSLYICPLELDTEHVIEGIKVTLLEANHCPGAALIHFRLRDGKTYLHTGDFRASELMQSHPLLASQHINVLYLDTTYCNPKYRFPPKEDVVSFVVRITHNFLAKQPKALIVVGAYSIGKEQVYLAISHALGLPIYTNTSRKRILQSFGWPELSGKLCPHGESSSLHVLPLSFLRHENLKEYMKTYKQKFTAVLAFRPTGWTYSETTGTQLDLIKPNCKGSVTIYAQWWSFYGTDTPELRAMAIRILNLTTSSSGCERNWSTFEMVHTKKRNRLSPKKLHDLVYVKFNARLKNKSAIPNRDPLVAYNKEERITKWLVPDNGNDMASDDEVFPGEQLTFRQVAIAMGANPKKRKSRRVKKAVKISKGRASSSKSKRPAMEEEEEEELESTSDSSSNDKEPRVPLDDPNASESD